MVTMREVEKQLTAVNCNFKIWGRAEIRELCNVLMPEEKIAQAVNGTYEGGFAMLCITNYRVLLVDRKPMLLTIEDIRYDMMAEVDYNNRLMGATIRIYTPMRNLIFTSWSIPRMRIAVNYIQQRVMELRQHGLTAQQLSGTPPSQSAPGWLQNSQPAVGYKPMNPYVKGPMLSRSKRFPSLY
jgi:hypothetical protein